MRVSGRILLMSGILATCVAAVAISAPPAPSPPSQSDGNERDRMRFFLERRLNALEADRAEVIAAIDDLNAGASLEDVRASLEERAPGGDEPLNEAQRQELRQRAAQILEETNPELFQRWQDLQERDPERAEMLRDRMVERLMNDGPMRELVDLLDRDPEQFQIRAAQFALERQAWGAARRYTESMKQDDEAAATAARDELRGILQEQFEKRIEEQRMSLDDAETRLEQMKARLDDQITRRDALVDARLEDMLERAANWQPRRDRSRRPPAPRGDQRF